MAIGIPKETKEKATDLRAADRWPFSLGARRRLQTSGYRLQEKMAETPTFAQQMVTKLQAALLKSPLAKSVTIDGTSVAYEDAIKRLQYFERRAARENGTRPIVSRLTIPGKTL